MGRKLVKFVDSQLKFDSKLVRMVREHTHLFDTSHKLFEDGTFRMETWNFIGNELGKSDIYCEKRWVYIVNRFYDEILYIGKYGEPSLWLLYPQLEFLQAFIDWADFGILCNVVMEEV